MAGASSTSSSLSTLFGLFLALLALQLFTWSEVDPFNAKLVAFRQTLLRTHVFIAANDNSIEYSGRWVSSPDQMGRDAGFGGSSFQFSVFNTTSVVLELANSYPKSLPYENETNSRSSLIITPAKVSSLPEEPVSFYQIVNGFSNVTFHQDVIHFHTIARQLDCKASHTFKIMLPYTDQPNVLQLRGIWVREGGQLQRLEFSRAKEQTSSNGKNNTTNAGDLKQERISTPRTLVEIMTPISLLRQSCSSIIPKDTNSSWTVNWPTLLEDRFHPSTFSTISISPKSCLTSHCGDKVSKPQITFLRSGPPNTALHRHPWTFHGQTSKPRALILSLGLSDVEFFLTASQSHGKHDLTTFIDDLSHQYSTFIQMLRRTVYSPSSLAATGSHTGAPVGYTDESHLYNSVPSTLPIFIVLPPIPSALLVPYAQQLKSLLHHTAQKTLDDLKWHIGDQKTILIDTAGWLDDADYIHCPSHNPREGGAGDEKKLASEFILSQSGHVKFAYHLSLHLCPYVDGGEEGCPFERHGEYTGNLVVPEVDGVGKALEQKRVGRIKEVFGFA